MVREERMGLDLLRAIDTKALSGVAGEQTSEDAPRLCANVVAEHKRIMQDLLVH